MFKNDKIALYLIIAFASFQTLYASVLPIAADEAYVFFKGSGKGWFSQSHPGIGILGTYFASNFSDEIFILRLPSIIMMSFAAAFIFKSALILSGKIGGWAALLIFLFTPSVNAAYIAATPASTFILFSAIAFFFWIKAFKEDKINYYVGAGATSGFLIMIHYGGFFLFALALLYITIFDKKKLFTKSFIIALIFFIISPAALLIAGFTGIDIAPAAIPFLFTESKSVLLLVGLVSAPVILYAIIMLIMDRFRTKELNFLQLSLIGSVIFYVILALASNVDLRYIPAFFIPSFILAGAYFSRKGNKIFIGLIMALSVIVSVYGRIGERQGFPILSAMKTSSIYEAINLPIAKILGNSGAIYALNIPDASLYAFYTKLSEDGIGDDNLMINMTRPAKNDIAPAKHPEPCLPGVCSQKNGVFVTENKDIDPKNIFPLSEYYGIFRLTTPNEGTKSFYVHTVRQ